MFHFFIVGVGRSGTSLLQSILSSHSQLCLPPETAFLREVVFSFKKYKSLTYDRAVDIYPRLKRSEKYISKGSAKTYNNEIEFYKSYLEDCGNEQNKTIVGDKDPRLIEFISATTRIFPNAKFVHIIRDPRDVLLSKKKADWSKDRSLLNHIFVNYVQLKLGHSTGSQLYQNQYHVLVYEDLLKKPEDVITNLCKFIGVDFEESMLHFQKKAKELVAEEELQWKKETTGPLLNDNYGKWEGKLSNWEVALTETLCKQAFKLGNYSKSNIKEELPFFSKLTVYLSSFFLKIMGRVYIIYRYLFQQALITWKL